MFLLYIEAQNWTKHASYSLISDEQKGKITSFVLLAAPCLTKPRMLLALLDTRAHYWLMFHLFSIRAPGPSLPSCFSAECPQHVLVFFPGVAPSQGQDFAFLLDELHEVPVRPFLQIAEVSLEGSMTHWRTHHSSQFCIICKVVENALCPSS